MRILEINPTRCCKVFSGYGKFTFNDDYLFEDPKSIDLVIFTGGSDISPELYGEKRHSTTYSDAHRDIYESIVFDKALEHNIPCVGICRGAQLLCVKAGGKLVQDITGHRGSVHKITTYDGYEIVSNSCHHQMQLPPKDAIPLAWATNKLSLHYKNGDDVDLADEIEKEFEVVYYPEINSLGVQYHPEWLDLNYSCVKFVRAMVNKYILKQKNWTKGV